MLPTSGKQAPVPGSSPRAFAKYRAGTLDAAVLAALFEVGDDRFLPAELRPEGSGLRYRALPRHRLRAPRPAEPQAASQDEWESLLRAASCWRDRFLLVLLWFGGLRIGEALGLRREDLHFMDHARSLGCSVVGPHLHVVRREGNANGASAKSRNDRSVPVGPLLLAYYDRYVDERLACADADRCDFVFVNLFHPPLGHPMSTSAVRQCLRGLSRRAGLDRPVHPHMLRHSAGTELTEAGAPIDVVQALLGHRSITSTQAYVHPSRARMREAVEALEARTASRRAQSNNQARPKRERSNNDT